MVVSVYGEDFRWISSTLAGGGVDSVFIYNKGTEKFGCKDDRVRVIVVPNVGREGESTTTTLLPKGHGSFRAIRFTTALIFWGSSGRLTNTVFCRLSQ